MSRLRKLACHYCIKFPSRIIRRNGKEVFFSFSWQTNNRFVTRRARGRDGQELLCLLTKTYLQFELSLIYGKLKLHFWLRDCGIIKVVAHRCKLHRCAWTLILSLLINDPAEDANISLYSILCTAASSFRKSAARNGSLCYRKRHFKSDFVIERPIKMHITVVVFRKTRDAGELWRIRALEKMPTITNSEESRTTARQSESPDSKCMGRKCVWAIYVCTFCSWKMLSRNVFMVLQYGLTMSLNVKRITAGQRSYRHSVSKFDFSYFIGLCCFSIGSFVQ